MAAMIPVNRRWMAVADGSEALASHLLRRAAFGGSAAEVASVAAAGIGPSIDRLLNYDPTAVETLQPPAPKGKALDLTKLPGLQLWWLDRMARTPSPLQEVMTLFWHNHFATGNAKVGNPPLMQRQNQLFRTNALGSFRTMLQQVTADPAMLIWLDGTTSHKKAPNENYGRELMELFTLGIGNYTEDDVHAAARAFTGFHTDKAGHVVFNPKDHDDSIKTFLGQTGPWGPNDAINIILSQPAHPLFLAGKLWRFFIGPNPTPAQIAPHAAAYRAADYDIKTLVSSILHSPDFADPANRYALVRSPAEVVVATLRALQPGQPLTQPALPYFVDNMGMQLFNPPNVGGWPGGLASPNWINPGTLMTRFNFAELAAQQLPQPAIAAAATALAKSGSTQASSLVDAWSQRLGVGDLTQASLGAVTSYAAAAAGGTPKTAQAKARGVVQLLLASPEFQLK
jgi:uncharacterized protein (DUF1800 family)